MYPACLPFRERQADYWLNNDSFTILRDFRMLLKKHKKALKNIEFLRLNESGDFYSQECVIKLNKIAHYLKKYKGIETYTYTARSDLQFSENDSFLVKGSSNNAGNNGKTIARNRSKMVPGSEIYHEKGENFEICPMNCRGCMLCKEKNNLNVVFPLH